MSSQFVDIDQDGFQDIITGSFSGTPQWIAGSADGYQPPTDILDSEGEAVLISAYWDTENKEWADSERSQTHGHCTSVAVVDWEGDGDLDLILGGYYEGGLFLRINEGSPTEPEFATTNSVIKAAGKAIVIPKGLAAPRVVDWNGDGRFDILCGGAKGGVYYFENDGTATSPSFAAARTLIEKPDTDAFVVEVPSADGMPTLPGSSLHIDPVDYDGDGDLDLLVGARSSWAPAATQERTADDRAEFERLNKQLRKLNDQIQEKLKGVEREDFKEVIQTADFQSLSKEMTELRDAMEPLAPSRPQAGDFVWVYIRN